MRVQWIFSWAENSALWNRWTITTTIDNPYACGFSWSDTEHGCLVHKERAETAAVLFGCNQPCQRCKWILKNTRYRKLFTHVESHASPVSLLESAEYQYIKAISNNNNNNNDNVINKAANCRKLTNTILRTHLFMLFIGRAIYNMTAPWGPIRSGKCVVVVIYIYILIQQPNEDNRWKYLHTVYVALSDQFAPLLCMIASPLSFCFCFDFMLEKCWSSLDGARSEMVT